MIEKFSGEENLTTDKLAVWVNKTLGLTGSDQYTAGINNKPGVYQLIMIKLQFQGTVRNWLHYCGFDVTECKKSIYVDKVKNIHKLSA